MKKLFLLLVTGLGLVSCKKEDIKPKDEVTTPPVIEDTTSTNTSNFKFGVNTNILTNTIDSIEIIHFDYNWTSVDTLTFTVADIVGIGSNLKFTSSNVDVSTMNGVMYDNYQMTIYLSTPTSSTYNKVEFGTDESETPNYNLTIQPSGLKLIGGNAY